MKNSFGNRVLQVQFSVHVGFHCGCYVVISALVLYIGMPQFVILCNEMPSVFIRVETHNL